MSLPKMDRAKAIEALDVLTEAGYSVTLNVPVSHGETYWNVYVRSEGGSAIRDLVNLVEKIGLELHTTSTHPGGFSVHYPDPMPAGLR